MFGINIINGNVNRHYRMTQLHQPRRPLLPQQHSSTKTFSFFALIFCQFYVIYTYLKLVYWFYDNKQAKRSWCLESGNVFWQTATVHMNERTKLSHTFVDNLIIKRKLWGNQGSQFAESWQERRQRSSFTRTKRRLGSDPFIRSPMASSRLISCK